MAYPFSRSFSMKNLFRISVFTIIALNLGGTLFGLEPGFLLFLAATAALVTGFPLMSKGFQKAAFVFLTLGIAMLVLGRQPFDVWMESASSMTNIIAIVAVMQTFTVPIRVGGYDKAIKSWMEGRFQRKSSLFLFMTLTIHILTSFLNLGSLPVTVGLFETTLKARVSDWRRFYARAATRGYVLAALWSPGAVNLYLVVQASGLTWSKVFLPGFILASLGMGVSYLVEAFGTHRNEELKAESRDAEAPIGHMAGLEAGAGSGGIIHIVAVAGSFILMAALLEWLHIGAASGRTVLAGALIVICWILSQARRSGMKDALKAQWLQGTLKVADIAPFFVSMGVFSGALERSGLLELAAPFLKSAAGSLGSASIIFIALGIVAGSIVGLHPFITIVLFGKILSFIALPIPPITVALSLAVGGAAAYMVTPFAGVIMTISRLTDTKAIDVALRWNWRFSLLFLAAGLLYAFGWGALFG
jgi:hypothetical protein